MSFPGEQCVNRVSIKLSDHFDTSLEEDGWGCFFSGSMSGLGAGVTTQNAEKYPKSFAFELYPVSR